MNASKKTTCIIPFYNEGQRIIFVLDVITKIKEISQIICVDDGSTDTIANQIFEKWPQIKLVRLPYNQGKTAAVRHALAHAIHDFVLLMDADLQLIDPAEISFAIKAMQRQETDMLILRRIKAPWFVKMDRGDILFSGERILKRTDLQAILKKQVQRYQLEIAINHYMLERNKEVFWVPSSASNTFKMKKIGKLEGFIKELDMFTNIVLFIGLQRYLLQIAVFARKPYKTTANQKVKQLHNK